MAWWNWLITAVDWRTALSTTAISTAIWGVLIIWIKSKIENSIKSDVDSRMELLKSNLRKEEEEFRNSIKRNEDAIVAIRHGALTGASARSTLIDKRRIEAAERLWGFVVDMAPFKNLSGMGQFIKMEAFLEEAAEEGQKGRKLRELADMILKESGIEGLKFEQSAEKERLFLPEIVWAMFKAYCSIVSYTPIQLMVARAGVKDIIKHDVILDMARKALPEHSAFLDEHGASCLPFLVEHLEEKIRREIVNSLDGKIQDEANVKIASEIIKMANQLNTEIYHQDKEKNLFSEVKANM